MNKDMKASMKEGGHAWKTFGESAVYTKRMPKNTHVTGLHVAPHGHTLAGNTHADRQSHSPTHRTHRVDNMLQILSWLCTVRRKINFPA